MLVVNLLDRFPLLGFRSFAYDWERSGEESHSSWRDMPRLSEMT